MSPVFWVGMMTLGMPFAFLCPKKSQRLAAYCWILCWLAAWLVINS